MKKMLRALVVATCSVVAVGVVSCGSSQQAAPAAGTSDVTYKCACGKTAKVAGTAAAPS